MQQTGYQMVCNLCGFTSPVPSDYTATLDTSGVRTDFYERPELHAGVYDLKVPADYNVDSKPPVPMRHVFLVDTSQDAVKSGLTAAACTAIEMALFAENESAGADADGIGADGIGAGFGEFGVDGAVGSDGAAGVDGAAGSDGAAGGNTATSRGRIAIIGYDSRLKFFDLSPSLQQARESIVGDLTDPFVPFYGGIWADPVESRGIIETSLERLQSEPPVSVKTALGSALKAADILLAAAGGGQVSAFVGAIPSLSPGALRAKLPPHGGSIRGMAASEYARSVLRAGNIFFRDELEAKFLQHNVGVSFFVGSQTPVDSVHLARLAARTGGALHVWPVFSAARDELDLAYAAQRWVRAARGYQAQLKIRCSRGWQVANVYMAGCAFAGQGAASAAIPVVGPDTSIACDFVYDGNLNTKKDAHFQAALLYTGTDGQRRVRVINSVIAVTERIADVFSFADCGASVALLARSMLAQFPADYSLVSIRNKLVSKLVHIVAQYGGLVGQPLAAPGQLTLPRGLSTFPMMILGLLKCPALLSSPYSPDNRVASYYSLTTGNSTALALQTYPVMFALHRLKADECRWEDGDGDGARWFHLPQAVPLSQSQLEAGGAYLIFNGTRMMLWIHPDVAPELLHDLFGDSVASIDSLDPEFVQLPVLDNPASSQVRALCEYLSQHYLGLSKHSVQLCRFHMDRNESQFLELMYEDRSAESVWSYQEMLRFVHKRVQTTHVDKPATTKRFGIF